MKLKFESEQTIEKPVLFSLAIVLALSAALIYATFSYTQAALKSNDWVNQTHALISEVDSIISSLQAGEAELKTYLISGDERTRSLSRKAYAEAIEHLDLARNMTRDDPTRQEALEKVSSLLNRRIEFARRTVSALPAGIDEVRKLLSADASSTELGEILAHRNREGA